jgi:hypothetical protein
MIFLMAACTGVSVYRHPDYNFPPTDPSSIQGYGPNEEPTYPYIIIGTITIDASWSMTADGAGQKASREAAKAGADGVLIRNAYLDITVFNRYVTVDGYSTGDAFHASIRPHYMPYATIIFYGYLIKRVG